MSLLAAGGAVVFFVGVLVSIALHEIGHFVPAKIFGVKVSQYFVGFGKTLWSTKRGETEYGIKAIPAGGYVRLIGMMAPDASGRSRRWSTGMFQSMIDGARSQAAEEILPGEQDRAFYNKPWWQKVIVMLGGPMVNIVLAFLLIGAAMIGIGVYQPTVTIGSVSDCVLPATSQRSTCRAGDTEAPAKAAGIEPDDQVRSINGTTIHTWRDAQDAIRAVAGQTVPFVVDRGGVRKTLHVSVIANKQVDLTNPSKYLEAGFIGVSPTEARVHATVGQTVDTVGSLTAASGAALVHIPARMVGVAKAAFGGQRGQNSPMSVVGASRLAGEMATGDIGTGPQLIVSDRIALLLQWLGGLNLFIGLFNLVPLLPLDGGHVAGALWEALKRGVARLRNRPDPGHVDIAKALPLAYAMASVLIVMGALLIYADIVNPVRLG